MKQIKLKSLLLMILALLLSVTAAAYDVQVDGIYYNFDGNNAIVTYGENNYRGDIVIPERIINNGIEYIVSSIGNAAFYWCSELTSVVLSDSIKSIGNSAFHKCEALTTIIIPNSVTTIDNAAF